MTGLFFGIEPGQVWTFKLTSGEEVIAKVDTVHLNSGKISLLNPLSVGPGPQGMHLVPSLFTSNREGIVHINTNNISMYAETDEAVRIKYIEATTGITVPEKKILVG